MASTKDKTRIDSLINISHIISAPALDPPSVWKKSFSAYRLATASFGFGLFGENHSLKQSSPSGTTLKLLFQIPSQNVWASWKISSNFLQGFPTGQVFIPVDQLKPVAQLSKQVKSCLQSSHQELHSDWHRGTPTVRSFRIFRTSGSIHGPRLGEHS